jgi:lipopolysaccharide/colanic/teichoic acid biosynthesis glycosyltransferase
MEITTAWIDAEPAPGRARYLLMRSVAERLLVLLSLPLLLPICGVIAVAIRLESPGPVLFRQLRPGIGQSVFSILKFRTMRIDSCNSVKPALRSDPRVTRLGGLLRLLHLDELPQAWNILRGEMSLIGPRPEPLANAEAFEAAHPAYRQRRSVLPGVTGWAQVCLGYTDDLQGAISKLEYDLYYIRNLSFRLDLAILARTLFVVITARGAR